MPQDNREQQNVFQNISRTNEQHFNTQQAATDHVPPTAAHVNCFYVERQPTILHFPTS
jgi:hypothetical protein